MSTTHVSRARLAYPFIHAHRGECSTKMICDELHVAPSGYHAWRQQPQSDRAIEDTPLLRLIRAAFSANHGINGTARVSIDL